MTAKERFELPFWESAGVWEGEPFRATVKNEFAMYPLIVPILIFFKPGEIIDGCSFGCREYEDKKKWVVRFERHSLFFQIPAPVFFDLFNA